MRAGLTRERKTNPSFTYSPDGVHPTAAGHVVMAQALMGGLNLSVDENSRELKGKVLSLVHQRQRLLTDAWLTHTGHKRPLKAGLPLDEARTRAADLDRQIRSLLN
jgi:hypothetical protein